MRFSKLAALALAFASVGNAPAFADVLAGWNTSTLPGGAGNFGASPLAATTTAPNVTVGGLTRGSGVVVSGASGAARGWGGVDWTSSSAATAATAGDFATFAVTATAGFQVSFSSISRFDYRRSGTGPDNGVLQYQIGGGAFVDIQSLAYTSTAAGGASLPSIGLSSIAALQNVPAGTTVTFRVVNYRVASGGGSTGTWYVFDVANSTASDLEISGTVASAGLVDGACGSANGQHFSAAPSTNLCAVGTPSSVSGTGPWTWSCAGVNGGSTASCSALPISTSPLTVFHMNDVHARLTPHKWVINQHGSNPDTFENVGGAAYLAGELLSLVNGSPTALVLDGGDISEGNPIGDMNCTTPQGGGSPVCNSNGFGNGGMTAFYSLLHSKLTAIGGARGTRGIDALVVGNHDVRDISYIQNMEQMRNAGVPVISVNVRDIATHLPHFAATAVVNVDGHKVGVVGYTTSTATVGASLANTLEVVDCQWSGSAVCNISDYVTQLRDAGCDIVILLTHDGHSDLVDPATPVLADTGNPKVPEIAVTGHWHTWAETVWQPDQLHYKTIFTESSSYMKYIGELHVSSTGQYLSSTQHVLRNADITPDPDVQAFVTGLIAQYNAAHPGHPVDEVVGYTNDPLELDNRMKWWSADEYPWSGNNSAGQWITDAMKWKCDHIAWASGGGCDLAIEAGGGVRADIPAGPVTYLQVYETFPWADDLYVRVSMTGQDIINFLNATNLDTGFSRELDVTAFDGIISSVKMNGQPIGLSTVYKVAINNYMLAHPPNGYTWPATANAENDPSNELVRDSLSEFMRSAHGTQATAYAVGGARYHFNGEYAGAYRAVVTMLNDNDSKPVFENAFIRLLSANDETLARRGSRQVPASIVNGDGSVVGGNRLAEQQLYRSYLGFKQGALQPGDIVEVWGKSAFFGGDPEFVDQEGIYGDGQEFKILGHDASLAQPSFVSSIDGFMDDNHKNHYIRFRAKRTAADMVIDQNGRALKIWDRTAFASASLPGTNGQTLEITGTPTMESFGLRFRSDTADVTPDALVAPSEASSHVNALTPEATAPVTLTATAAVSAGAIVLAPIADAQVASGNPNTNVGSATNMFIQGSTAAGTFGVERAFLRFDLSGIAPGTAITGAQLQLYNWKSTGVSMPTEARAVSSDAWTEGGITWNTQPPVTGSVLDTKTLVQGVINTWYAWDVTSFVQGELAGDKAASFVVKPVDENLAGAPSFGFDAKEFGSNSPALVITTQANASSVASLGYFYRYSTDQTNWTAWTALGSPLAQAPYSTPFAFPNGFGYYEFYSVATDNLGHAESTPAGAQTRVHYQGASGSAQSIIFGSLPSSPVGTSLTLAATATSGLPVAFSSQTPSVCSVSGTQLTALNVGNCIVQADQPGNVGRWLAASSVQSSFSVTGLPQSITFASIPDHPLSDGSLNISAAASSGLAVTVVSNSTSVCTIAGNLVTLLAQGTCSLTASQPGDSSYAAAPPITRTFIVSVDAGSGDDAGGDAPLPLWSVLLLALGMLAAMHRRGRTA